MSKRRALVRAVAFSLFAIVCWGAPVSAKDRWTSVRSKNFFLLGNASEKDIRQVAVRLEQFRDVFARLFPTLKIDSPVPTTVIVFKNEDSYRPFKWSPTTAGYFQPGSDVNYITLQLTNDLNNDQDPFAIILHEYTHLLVRNTNGNVPTWFNEGLAEYYSSFSIAADQKVVMGRPIANHVLLLRKNKMLPLRKLFQVDQKSPYYNERDKQSMFYAESWALVHYLMLGKDGQRMTKLIRFVDLLSAGSPMEQAFQQAFAMTFEDMEKELNAYIQRDRYPILNGSFHSKIDYDREMQAASITEAEALAYLGDLLLKGNRADAEIYLEKALALDPDLPMANASLGLLRMRQGRHAEARKKLERAVAASSQNYLIHYYYAYTLSQSGNADMETVMGMPPETATIIRRELKRAIHLRPDFLPSFSLLAFVNLVTENELDETMEMLKQALAGSPRAYDLMFMLAQIHLRKQDFETSRQLIAKVIENGDDDVRHRAQGLLTQLVAVEEQLTRINKQKDEQASHSRGTNSAGNDSGGGIAQMINRPYDPVAVLRESLRKPAIGETQTQGKLTRIDCDAKGITFLIKVNDRLLKLNTDTFLHANIISFSDDAGREITCGTRKTENSVVVAYIPPTDRRARIDGVIKSLEFVPADFKLRP